MNELILERYKYWENRKVYIDLMETFVDSKITGIEFESKFLQIWKFDRNRIIDSSKLSIVIGSFESAKLEKFSSLISLDLFLDLEIFEPNSLLREDCEIGEDELKGHVEKLLLKLKKYI